jgi:hypothetical protein
VPSSGLVHVPAWVGTILSVVWLLTRHAERLASACSRLLNALDQRAVRQAALKARNDKDRGHCVDLLKTLRQPPDEPPPCGPQRA